MPEEINIVFPVAATPISVTIEQPEIIVEFPGSSLIPPSRQQVLTLTASMDIGGHRGVSVDHDGMAAYADKGSSPDCIGISTGAAEADAALVVQTAGEMSEPGWSWAPGAPVYLGDAGVMTQTAPTTGHLVQIGVATATNRLLLNISEPITL